MQTDSWPFIFISDTRNLWLTSVLLLWWFQFGCLVQFFRWLCFGPRNYFHHDWGNYCGRLCNNYNISELQNICSRTTPHKSNSSFSSTTRSTEWRKGECWEAEKIWSHYSVRLSCVFGLLFANLCTVTLVFLNSSPNPLIYCWNMRNIRHNFIDGFRNAAIFMLQLKNA